ncbi:MAG: carboxypeptidase regulatory-like domain-containing protein [Armatimonadetes bacterium]|nr:carboxypeptidase regulatory-like domain-containing protein [Armatimonadota bacterium]
MKRFLPALTVLALLASGCGGDKGSRTSVINGTVLDIDNNPVRDAVVSTGAGSARTSATGAYTLPKQPAGAVEITAEIVRNGVRYRGSSTCFNYDNERTQNVNIIVGPENELGSIYGTVRDRNGFPLDGASVFAYNGAGSSTRVFSDANGRYEFRDLVGGVTYAVLAGGQGYSSDSTQVNLGTSDSRSLDFVLDDPAEPDLDPPQDLTAVTWVSPNDATKGKGGDPYEAVKSLLDPKRKSGARTHRSKAPNGVLAEVDLEWTGQQFVDLLGYGVYKANSGTGTLSGVDFIPDPLAAFYVDLDLNTSSTYSYALTTISSLFPEDPEQTESTLSTRVVAKTLGVLKTNPVTFSPLTFRWQAGSGAQNYAVFVFEEFPGVGVPVLWSSNRTSATSVPYTGGPLASGLTYYYLVVGFANGDASRTISQIDSFKAP